MSEWKTYKLDDLGKILNSKRVPLNSRERENKKGIFPYYGASGIVDHIDDYIFEGEHVLISEDGENLRSRQTPIAFKANGKFWVNNHAHIFRGREEWINDFIVYYFQNSDLSPYITGAAQPKLNKENLLRIPIKYRNDDYAKQIASILSSLDDKIELNLQMNQTLETMAQAIFKEWFVNFNFPKGLNYDSSDLLDGHDLKKSEQSFNQKNHGSDKLVDGLPEGWKMGKVSDFCKVNVNTLNAKDDIREIHYIEISEVDKGVIKNIAVYKRGEEPSRAKENYLMEMWLCQLSDPIEALIF